MTDGGAESGRCAECGGAVTEGLCRSCLLRRGLETDTVAGTQRVGAAWVPPEVGALAGFFPELEIVSLLGRGGMGAVYTVRQKSLDRVAALKILPPELAAGAGFPERFGREAQALARMNHPHIVTIYDYGRRDGEGRTVYFLLMELVDGVSLRRVLDGGRMEAKAALAIVPEICEALAYAHDRGIVHRDIKPENILMTKEGAVKIADFGVATLMGGGEEVVMAGTAGYMAPEQAGRAGVDHRADIYALGVVFYQMLTGEMPGKEWVGPSRKVRVDVRLDEVVLRALEREPERRYRDATEMKTAVEGVAGAGGADQVSGSGAGGPGGVGVREAAVDSLRIPSIGLRIAITLNLLGMLGMTGVLLLSRVMMAPGRSQVVPGVSLLFVLLIVCGFAINLFLLRAFVGMGRLRSYNRSIAACIVTFLVFPGNLLAIPFAVWALIVLSRAETKAAFEKGGVTRSGSGKWGRSADAPSLRFTLVSHLLLLILLVVMFGFVFPKFALIFKDFHYPLPAMTEWAFGITHASSAWACFILPAVCAMDIAACVVLARVVGRQGLRAWSCGVIAVCGLLLMGCTLAIVVPLFSLRNAVAANLPVGRESPASSSELAAPRTNIPFRLVPLEATEAAGRGREVTGDDEVAQRGNSAFVKTLPSGIVVELVGVSESPSDHAAWWRPDGLALGVRPYAHLPDSIAPYPHALPREFLIQMFHLPRESVDTLWKFDPSATSAGGGPLVVDGKSRSDLTAIAALVLDQPLTVRFGVASGSWKTVAEAGPEGVVMGIGHGSVMFAPVSERNGGSAVSVAHNLKLDDVRVIATDLSDREHKAGQSMGGNAEAMSQLNVSFPDLQVGQIRKLCLQSRQVEWVEFKDVSQKPRASSNRP